jgi:hypothetical protein
MEDLGLLSLRNRPHRISQFQHVSNCIIDDENVIDEEKKTMLLN